MFSTRCYRLLACWCLVSILLPPSGSFAADLSEELVVKSIDRAKAFLLTQQNRDGSWSASGGPHKTGISSLALLALINGGMTAEDPPIQHGLKYLRSLNISEVSSTYEVSLMIMALAAAKDGERDKTRILTLAHNLENGQITRGNMVGCWDYSVSDGLVRTGGDRSNGQFAVLGLRDAAEAGIVIDRKVWKRAQDHWLISQNSDGGWGYNGRSHSTGSMTVAGISSMSITARMLHDDDDVNADGTPRCCTENNGEDKVRKSIERGVKWMERNFAVGHNPRAGSWLLYYLYGMERAGRLSARRFFGDHDWYREGAAYLIAQQSRVGVWKGVGGSESNPVVGTSFAVLFLSKGLAPVLINKLKYGDRDPANRNNILGNDWDQHHDDVRNLTEHITGLEGWPRLLTWQTVDIGKVAEHGSMNDLMQSKIMFISGSEQLVFDDKEIEMLREYVGQGGFVFAVNCCNGAGFHDGMHEMVKRMYPNGEVSLKKLPNEHPIFFTEHALDPATVELLGVDVGCRTAIVYSPNDLSCLWNKWARRDPPNRSPALKGMITKATRIGVNIVAYAVGREPPSKLGQVDLAGEKGQQDKVQRGLLQIAKIRHTGGWDAAPRALRNLLLALNRTVGLAASTKQRNLPASDSNIFRYPILYMHGRNSFQMGRQEIEQLKKYLDRGGVLFADACCGSLQFDRSFRRLTGQLFPQQKLKRVPPDHPLFSSDTGHDIRQVKRRVPEINDPRDGLKPTVRTGEPFLEGIEIDGRLAVIYSKYDISCALERQASVACTGYVEEDAVKIAINILLYAMQQ